MSDRKLAKAVQSLLKQIWRLHRSISKALITWLLRTALIINRKARLSTAGFVLPTTVLLILVVSLTAGALAYRAFNTSSRTIAETQNRAIYNAASPAADRARAKIEFLFDSSKDTRYPGGVPSEAYLVGMMLNDGSSIKGTPVSQLQLNGTDPYTLPDETRIDINGDGKLDNAWRFRTTTGNTGNPNAQDATVVYSIILSTPPDQSGSNGIPGWQQLIGLSDLEKATGKKNGTGAVIEGSSSSNRTMSYARSGPLSNSSGANTCANQGSSTVQGGWYPDTSNTSNLLKNFQIDALVIPDSATNAGGANNFTTIELNQDRILNLGNKWGAWFRNDMEIFPGPQFNWNGAMHTEGSLLIGGSSFNAYLISSPSSCLYNPAASSEISVTTTTDTVTNQPFTGIISAGRVNDDSYGGSSLVYLWSTNPTLAANKPTLGTGNDWLQSSSSPTSITLDPIALQVRNGYQSRASDTTNKTYNSNLNGTNHTFDNRFYAKAETAPYVDDTFRADNRYGPKLKYDSQKTIPAGSPAGSLIPASDPNYSTLVSSSPSPGADASAVGLDGYWERRARIQGLRVLVGQRLELGNANGWTPPQDRPSVSAQLGTAPSPTVGDNNIQLRKADYSVTTDASQADPYASDNEGDPLYPAYVAPYPATTVKHEDLQRRALRDNISAVQSTAVYHAAVNTDYPIACLASTSHHGSPFTLRQSINFVPTFFVDSSSGSSSIQDTSGAPTGAQDTLLLTDFFNGRGTNGWEFEPPLGTQSAFETAIADPSSPLSLALNNLAQFAGDYVSDNQSGAFPPTQESLIHPYPTLTMWGNYSNLRRTLKQLQTGTSYSDLSPADKTYLQTAACTLGMLAYNIDRVQRFDPRNFQNDVKSRPGQPAGLMQLLGQDLYGLMDGYVDETATTAHGFEVLPKSQLGTYGYSNAGTYNPSSYNPRDYDRVPAEAFLGKLREYKIATSSASSLSDPELRTAELIFSYFQIRRDRTYGFRPSPAANTWNYNPFVTNGLTGGKTNLWSSACDPNMFSINQGTYRQTGATGATQVINNADLAAYRLGLSRLCGTVIPAGAERVGAGDTGLPQRNTAPSGSTPITAAQNSTTYIPTLNGAGATFPQGAPSTQSPKLPASPADASGRTQDFGTSTSLLAKSGSIYVNESYLQAKVAPKWPSLYFLFPEIDHGPAGAVTTVSTPGGAVTVDHRQPNGNLTDPATNATLLAAFQPWAELYITDNYISGTVNNSVTYKVVDSAAPSMLSAVNYPSYTTSSISFAELGTSGYQYVYKTFTNPVDDRPVYAVAVRPRKLPSGFTNPSVFSLDSAYSSSNLTTQLPIASPSTATTQYTPPNRILVPNGDNTSSTVTAVIPFLDRVIFNGREWLPARVTDIDLGMLRRYRPGNQGGGNSSAQSYSPNDVWLPVSGVVYAFREDAVREDAISRPTAAAGATCTSTVSGVSPSSCATNVTNLSNPIDPPLQSAYGSGQPLISIKQVDYVSDPDRRPYGFRLRDAIGLQRHPSMAIPDKDNIRGLSFFTDNPVYIMGDFNWHQDGSDDTAGNRLEEFTQQLPSTGAYNEAQFYTQRTTRDSKFANTKTDRWRPTEILADAVSVISENLCDGSAIDSFMTTAQGSGATISTATYSGIPKTDSGVNFPSGYYPYRQTSGDSGGTTVYNNSKNGLYNPGCQTTSVTTYLNQNRPSTALPANSTSGWSWLRENPFDIFSPVKVSRGGQGLLQPPLPTGTTTVAGQTFPQTAPPDYYQTVSTPQTKPTTTTPSNPRVPGTYNAVPTSGGSYYTIGSGRSLIGSKDTRVNSIIVGGMVPSRKGQSYGGLHNFPRFIENWGGDNLWFSGSFLQLSFGNYATAPFDQDAVEPTDTPSTGTESIPYYSPPKRLWGYDVALQMEPAGPAASRFVSPTKNRNEFYKEPAANDPYIQNLCKAVKNNPPSGVNVASLKCPT